MLRRIGLVFAVLLVAVLGFAATRPDTFHVERSTSIMAPPEAIFARIGDFREWTNWSPFEGLDPELRRSYDGAASGQGAVYEWDGNRQAGQGRMEIVAASPPSQVMIDLQFIRPFASRNTAEFTLRPVDGATEVTWAMHGPSTYVGKLMSVFLSMDRMIGPEFERGLASLKEISER